MRIYIRTCRYCMSCKFPLYFIGPYDILPRMRFKLGYVHLNRSICIPQNVVDLNLLCLLD